jgi:glycosyltransferase involved in cell wall biosynthesis
MQRCVQAFDIGAQPSLEETSSFSLKEQMAAEKPVVTSDFAACKEIVDDGVEGFTAPVGTVEPLADAIRRLAVDSEMRLRMGRAGRARVLREFSVQEFCRRTIEAYGKALEVHKMRPAVR